MDRRPGLALIGWPEPTTGHTQHNVVFPRRMPSGSPRKSLRSTAQHRPVQQATREQAARTRRTNHTQRGQRCVVGVAVDGAVNGRGGLCSADLHPPGRRRGPKPSSAEHHDVGPRL